MKKYESEKRTQFACFVRNATPSAIPLSVPLGLMEGQPKINNPHILNALFRRNWQQYCADATDETPNESGNPAGEDSPLDDPDLL